MNHSEAELERVRRIAERLTPMLEQLGEPRDVVPAMLWVIITQAQRGGGNLEDFMFVVRQWAQAFEWEEAPPPLVIFPVIK